MAPLSFSPAAAAAAYAPIGHRFDSPTPRSGVLTRLARRPWPGARAGLDRDRLLSSLGILPLYSCPRALRPPFSLTSCGSGSCGGGGGQDGKGGGGGGGQNGEASGGDGEDASTEQQVSPLLKKKLDAAIPLDLEAARVLAALEKNPFIRLLLQLVPPVPEIVEALCCSAIFVKDDMQPPLGDYSSSSTGDLQCSSSLDPSSSSTGASNRMGTKESHSDDNTDDEIENMLQQTTTPGNDDHQALVQDHQKGIRIIIAQSKEIELSTASLPVTNNPVNNIPCADTSGGCNVSDNLEKKKEGLLAANYTIAAGLSVICNGIFLPLAYFVAQKEQGKFEDTRLQAVFIGSFVAAVSSYILSARASYLEKSEIIDGFDLGIFKWMLLYVLVYLYVAFCTLLGAFENTPDWVPWTLGSIGSCSIVIVWYWFFYRKWPKIMEKINAGRIGEDLRSTKRPDPTQLV